MRNPIWRLIAADNDDQCTGGLNQKCVCVHLCECVDAGVKSNSVMRSPPSLPIKVIDATLELPQRRGCELGSRQPAQSEHYYLPLTSVKTI